MQGLGLELPAGAPLFAALHEGELPGGVPVYMLEHDALYDREGIYGDEDGDFGDNARRYAALSAAALQFGGHLGWRPDIYHVHDWQTGLVPAYIAAGGHGAAPSVLTIHNLGYQGGVGMDAMGQLGLSPTDLPAVGLEPLHVEDPPAGRVVGLVVAQPRGPVAARRQLDRVDEHQPCARVLREEPRDFIAEAIRAAGQQVDAAPLEAIIARNPR